MHMHVLLTTHNFNVVITRSTGRGPATIGEGSFQEVSGLEVEMDTSEVEEGGRNSAVWRKVGRAKYQPLVCKRGMFFGAAVAAAETSPNQGELDAQLWQWFQDVADNYWPPQRYGGSVSVFDQGGWRGGDGPPLAVWRFENAIPAKVVGPQLNAKTGDITIEELHIVHQGLRLAISSGAERSQ